MKSPVGQPLPHDAASRHVQGNAPYIDDLPMVAGTLHAAIGMSPVARGKLRSLDLGPVLASPGVVDAVDASSVTGDPNIGSVLRDEDVFAHGTVEFAGQAVFAVAARTLAQARRAAARAGMSIKELPPILTIEDALEKDSYIIPKSELPFIERDWKPAVMRRCPHVIEGQFHSGAQEHFYLEGQVAYAIPQEDGTMLVHSSTQHPSEVQHVVAGMLGKPINSVEVCVRRMGGGFGGKETNGAQPAAIAAMLATRTGRPVKMCLPRRDDFLLTGKRHPFLGAFKVGFDEKGRVLAADFKLAADCGISTDLSLAILDRALLHADNCYHLPCVRIRGYPCRTNKVSNTAFRGFGGPQGMLIIERALDDIARHLGVDPWKVRKANLYRGRTQRTPYGQKVADNVIPKLTSQLHKDSGYAKRRRDVARFNKSSELVKRGIALTPVKFGISFTVTFLNQAGALVHVYRDGTVALNHGGTEMGQGLYVKVAQVVASTFGLPLESVRCEATTTGKVPNTSATAASAGMDLNGKAAERAALTVRERLALFAAGLAGCKPAAVSFQDGQVSAKGEKWAFSELVQQAYLARVQMSASGYYSTPEIRFDSKARHGSPFFYFAYGAAVSEVEVDVLTGEHRLLRVDILHDIGESINPAVDMGQVEGGYAQGYGWLTSEELSWDEKGRPQVVGPATYKIPAAGDMPEDFNVAYWTEPNRSDTINRSKAVGEPPLMLAISAWSALSDAVAAASGGGKTAVALNPPATPERVLLAIEDRRK